MQIVYIHEQFMQTTTSPWAPCYQQVSWNMQASDDTMEIDRKEETKEMPWFYLELNKRWTLSWTYYVLEYIDHEA
jgi:hypothetical protein